MAPAVSPKYSIITTCKGRLRDLKRTLPEFLKQEDTEVIVVDYDCPEGTSEYVARVHPEARVVRAADKPKFNLPHARNLGAAQAKGEILIFLDADVVIAEHFVKYVGEHLTERSFAHFVPPARNSLRGQSAVWREDFARIGGYDELMEGYAGEDLDFYMRMRLAGAKQVQLAPEIVLEVIEQTTEERERHRSPDLKLQFLRGQLYSQAKEMFLCVQRQPVVPLALRRKLLEQVDLKLKALYAGEEDFVLEVSFPDRYKRGFLKEWEFSSSVSVKARRKKSNPR
jgi:glycosyltransferase involved in cell wall biosynthesis